MDSKKELDPKMAVANARTLIGLIKGATKSDTGAQLVTDFMNALTARQTVAMAMALATIAAHAMDQVVALASATKIKA